MVTTSRRLLIPALLLGWLGLSAEAFAAKSPEIRDEAKLFSSDAVEKANQKIKEIYRDYDKDLFIETVLAIPKNLQDKYKELGKGRFFVDWAEKRAADEGVKGIYVLICKEPAHLQVTVNKLRPATAFTRENGQKLSRIMLEKFAERKTDKRFDAGLLAGVDFVQSTLRANLPPQSAGKQEGRSTVGSSNQPQGHGPGMGGSIMGWVCIGVVILLAVWLVLGLVRALSGGGGGYGPRGYGPGGYGAGGGGGFLNSLLGGMFGAAAGMWMYDHFFGGHSGAGWGSQAHGGDYSAAAGNVGGDEVSGGDYGGGDFSGDDAAGGDAGGDFGGGDFGDGDAGGDFGGGDFGGGDFGGGDFGGGSDFGGGDF